MSRNPHPRPQFTNGSSNLQTVIDLTSEPEESTSISRSRDGRGIQGRPGSNVSNANRLTTIVDLTQDLDAEIFESDNFEQQFNTNDYIDPDEIMVTGSRLREIQAAASHQARRRQPNNRPHSSARSSSSSIYMPGGSGVPSAFRIPNSSVGLAAGLARLGQMFSPRIMGQIPAALVNLGAFQPMPVRMDYTRGAFDRKPEHVPPPAARDNFTRSPTSDDIIICPSCKQELVHNIKDSTAKKGGKAPSRKEREEHPFWVVKECGHVYCNTCFQNRGDKSMTTIFGEGIKSINAKGPSHRKPLVCAVDDCKSDVRTKDKWVGVFL